MNTYNTYQEAKIANPDCEINRHVNSEKIECFTVGLFSSVSVLPLGGDMIFYNERCEPSSFCPTVASFFSDGFLLGDGDVYINAIGGVRVVGSSGNSARACNEGGIINPNTCFILRAAALEEKVETESEYEKGMREAMKKIAVSCGRVFGADVGYEDLPDLVNNLINPPEKKPRTKVEYVKCEFDSVWEAIKSYEINDDLYYCASSTPTYEKMKAGNMKNLLDYSMPIKLYRRIETPMTWKEELYDYLDNSCEMSDDFNDSFTIEIEGKPLEFNLNDDGFVDMCKLVASLNSVN